jgi:hypothetical protein
MVEASGSSSDPWPAGSDVTDIMAAVRAMAVRQKDRYVTVSHLLSTLWSIHPFWREVLRSAGVSEGALVRELSLSSDGKLSGKNSVAITDELGAALGSLESSSGMTQASVADLLRKLASTPGSLQNSLVRSGCDVERLKTLLDGLQPEQGVVKRPELTSSELPPRGWLIPGHSSTTG